MYELSSKGHPMLTITDGHNVKHDLAKDQVWYIKVKDASAISTVKIEEVTDLTILVSFPGSYAGIKTRYDVKDLTFIELATD